MINYHNILIIDTYKSNTIKAIPKQHTLDKNILSDIQISYLLKC